VLINKTKLRNHPPRNNDYIGDKSGQKRTKADILKKNNSFIPKNPEGMKLL